MLSFKRLDKAQAVLFCSSVLLVSWLILILFTRGSFQNAVGTDPLAMVHVLFPSFWFLLAAFAVLCIFVVRYEFSPRWLHLVLLCELSLVLFYTPFALCGYSWSPDSLWHAGVANYMPQILSGSKPALCHYAESYPLSFVTTYCAEQVIGTSVFSYALYIYPVVCILAITVLAYLFVARLLSSKLAFASLVLALPSLHFIEPHVSPFSVGTIFFLVALNLLLVNRRAANLCLLFVIFALTITHPISPLTLGIFLFAMLFVQIASNVIFKKRGQPLGVKVSPVFLIVLGSIWYIWSVGYAGSVYTAVDYAIEKVATLSFLSRAGRGVAWSFGGFIYPEIQFLSLAIYGVFLLFAVACLPFGIIVKRFLAKRASKVGSDSHYGPIRGKKTVLAFSAILYAAYGYMLYAATGQHYLLGRGLLVMILMSSVCIGLFLLQGKSSFGGLKKHALSVFLFFLLFSFPIISYGKEAYNSFTPSSHHGLSFVASYIDLSNKSLSMEPSQQLASYVNLSKPLLTLSFPPDLARVQPDFVSLRSSSFFRIAMRYDFSFENNSFTRLRDNLTDGVDYDRVYSSSTFELFSHVDS